MGTAAPEPPGPPTEAEVQKHRRWAEGKDAAIARRARQWLAQHDGLEADRQMSLEAALARASAGTTAAIRQQGLEQLRALDPTDETGWRGQVQDGAA